MLTLVSLLSLTQSSIDADKLNASFVPLEAQGLSSPKIENNSFTARAASYKDLKAASTNLGDCYKRWARLPRKWLSPVQERLCTACILVENKLVTTFDTATAKNLVAAAKEADKKVAAAAFEQAKKAWEAKKAEFDHQRKKWCDAKAKLTVDSDAAAFLANAHLVDALRPKVAAAAPFKKIMLDKLDVLNEKLKVLVEASLDAKGADNLVVTVQAEQTSACGKEIAKALASISVSSPSPSAPSAPENPVETIELLEEGPEDEPEPENEPKQPVEPAP